MPDQDTSRTYVRETRATEPSGTSMALIVGGLVVAVGFILWLIFGAADGANDGATAVPASDTTNVTVEPTDQPADTTTNVTIDPAPDAAAPDAAPDAAVEDPAAPATGTDGEAASPPAEP